MLRLLTSVEHPIAQRLRQRLHRVVWAPRAQPLDIARLSGLLDRTVHCDGDAAASRQVGELPSWRF